MTALQFCFRERKLRSFRVLLRAGAITKWTADQVAIALGEVPEAPDMADQDRFEFACLVGNFAAAVAYCRSQLEEAAAEALMAAVKAQAVDIVEWLLGRGCDANALTDTGWGALETAVENDDIATAEALLVAGADPCGSSENEFSWPVKRAASEDMRAMFVRHGVNPAMFDFEVSPEAVQLSFLPEKVLTQQAFETHRTRRAGVRNPEAFLPDFWYEQLRTGRYSVAKSLTYVRNRDQPVWTFARYGRSATVLPDGRLVLIAGEHEDNYDPDFCIYADVTVLDGNGGVEHFIYPDDVFPPTDFHTATLCDGDIWLIGSLGYRASRRDGETQVLRLDLSDFSITPVATSGDAPGWIHGHRCRLVAGGLELNGGKIEPGYRDNDEVFLLDTQTRVWTKLS